MPDKNLYGHQYKDLKSVKGKPSKHKTPDGPPSKITLKHPVFGDRSGGRRGPNREK